MKLDRGQVVRGVRWVRLAGRQPEGDHLCAQLGFKPVERGPQRGLPASCTRRGRQLEIDGCAGDGWVRTQRGHVRQQGAAGHTHGRVEAVVGDSDAPYQPHFCGMALQPRFHLLAGTRCA